MQSRPHSEGNPKLYNLSDDSNSSASASQSPKWRHLSIAHARRMQLRMASIHSEVAPLAIAQLPPPYRRMLVRPISVRTLPSRLALASTMVECLSLRVDL